MSYARILLLTLTACAPVGTLHPKVIIDDLFTSEESGEIEDAARGWESVGASVRLDLSRLPHERLLQSVWDREGSDNVRIVRIDGFGDTSCPCFTWTSACGGATSGGRLYGLGETFDDGEGRRIICINVQTKNLTQVAAHEIGHALYQSRDHFPAPSVMAWDLSGSTLPTQEDGDRLHE